MFYMCSQCEELINMRASYAGLHSERTGHKVYIQTPEALFNRRSTRTKSEIVEAVELRSSIAPHIISLKHAEECKCAKCWAEFQRKWAEGHE